MIGKCLCGAVQFKLTGTVPNLYQCHCSQCRKQGGSTSNTATIVQEQQFSWLSGQERITQFRHPSGFNSHFCSACGSPVPNKLGDQRLFWIPAGLLDDSENLEIAAHLFVGSRARWDTPVKAGKQYREMPGLDDLIEVLQRPER